MQPKETTDAPVNAARVTLLEGARDRKPRPESYIDWPDGRPPGGPLPKGADGLTRDAQPNPPAQAVNKYRKRFLIKVAGVNDRVDELGEEPLTESVLTWLAAELNRDETPLMLDRPGTGKRGPKDAPLSIKGWAGFIAKNTAHFDANGCDGAGLYAEAEIMSRWVDLLAGIIGSPGGIDFTADSDQDQDFIVSVDIVVRPRGTGKVVNLLG